MTEFLHIVRKVYEEHGETWNNDLENGLKLVFQKIDTDNSTQISRAELHHALFHAMDSNGDGVWNFTEVITFIQDYADHLQRNLTPGW